MIRVVLDVNVLASGLPAPGGAPWLVVDRWLQHAYQLVTSEHILAGVARAWRNPYYASRFQPEQVREALALLRSRATLVVPADGVSGVAENEEDDLVLATALAGDAHVIVTGDRGLLRLGTFREIGLVSPREFLALLE